MKKIIIITTIIVVIAILVPFLGILYLSQDDSTAEDDDLIVSRIYIPEEENAFYCLEQAVEKIYWPEDKEELISDILDGEEWDSDFVKELISQNEESFYLLEEALIYPDCQVPEEMTRLDAPPPNAAIWLHIAQLSSIKAEYLFQQGKEKEAFDWVIKVIKIGHMMEGSQGGLIYYLIGVLIKGDGLDRLRGMLPDTTLPPELLRSYANELGELKADREGLAYVIKVEYTVMAKAIDDLSTGKTTYSEEGNTWADKMCRIRYFFKPNKTKRLFAEAYRVWIESIPKPCGEREHIEPPHYSEFMQDLDLESELSIIKFLLTPNYQGKIIYMVAVLNIGKFVSVPCQEDFSVVGTQLLLAVKCYKIETGRLPQSLEELVPEYISKVPEDPYGGNPIRYSPEKKVIYSVGEDLEDSGGSEGERWQTMEDPTFMIEF